MDPEPPPDSLSLTPEEREAAAAYLRTTFRLHPAEPEDAEQPVAEPPATGRVSPATTFVVLKKDPKDGSPP